VVWGPPSTPGVRAPGFRRTATIDGPSVRDEGAMIAVKIWKTIGWRSSRIRRLPTSGRPGASCQSTRRAPAGRPRTLVAQHRRARREAWLPLDDKNPEIDYYSTKPAVAHVRQARAPVKGASLAARYRCRNDTRTRGRVPTWESGRGRPGELARRLGRIPQLRGGHRARSAISPGDPRQGRNS